MRYLLTFLAALVFVPAVYADHPLSSSGNLHWPNTVSLYNRYPAEISPDCPDCRKIRVINRTGWTPTYDGEFALLSAVREVSAMLDWKVTFSVVSRKQILFTKDRKIELEQKEPTAAITLYQSPDTGTSSGVTTCDNPTVLRPTDRYKLEPYCQGQYSHIVAANIVFACTEFSCRGLTNRGTIVHELGHMVGLGDSYLLPDCGINIGSYMCSSGLGAIFTQHDHDISRAIYLGHVDLEP